MVGTPPRFVIDGPASQEETAAIAAAVEQFRADTAVRSAEPELDVVRTQRWTRFSRLESVGAGAGSRWTSRAAW